MVELGGYAKEILACEDRPLFEEAVTAAKVGALRASYLMIWLSCAESLKRKFREAQTRDSTAGQVVGRVEEMEEQHRAVDNFLLDKARDYGFVSESEKTILSQIYEMRCIYAHPYEEAPSEEKVKDAAASVVELVLSRPVKLRHGYVNQVLNSLLNNASFLDDFEPAVAAFATNMLLRIDAEVHVWLLDKYTEALESISDDPSMVVFTNRGKWFCRTMLADVGVDVLNHDEWHTRVGRYPKTLLSVCSSANIWVEIGELAQDSLVGSILNESETRAGVLQVLERLNNEGALTERQERRFLDTVSGLGRSAVLASGLRTRTCYSRLIDAMTSYNWYIQNPAIAMIISNGPGQASELSEEQQVDLGRNILQAGEGHSAKAIEFLQNLSSETNSWPFGVIRGIALESFTNEKGEIRFKAHQLPWVLAAMDLICSKRQVELIEEISESVKNGTVENYVRESDFERVTNCLGTSAWAAPLLEALNSKIELE